MIKLKKGIISPLFLGIITLLLIGGGVYLYIQQKTDVQFDNGKIDCLAINLPPDCKAVAKVVSSAPRGAPAAPGIFQISQPNGTKISIYTRGDEHFSWTETVDGYSIAKSTDGFWYYVSGGVTSSGPIPEDNHNGFILTNVQAHLPPPVNLSMHIRPPAMLVGN